MTGPDILAENAPADARPLLTEADVLAAAGSALGTELVDAVDLGGSKRSVVLRARRADDGATVVVKAYQPPVGDALEATDAYGREAAAVELLGPLGLSAELLAADDATPLLVLSDLGTARTLADLLLGDDPAAARAGLRRWAAALGRLGAAADVERFAALRAQHGPAAPGESTADFLADACRVTPELLADTFGITAPAGLDDDLAALVELAAPGPYDVVTPTDTCPDNVLFTPAGLRFVDFEGAEARPVFFDAAYTQVPFPTCWCVYDLGAADRDAMEGAYRGAVLERFPELADDAVWRDGVTRAVGAWLVSTTSWLLPTAIEADRSIAKPTAPYASRRAVLRDCFARFAGSGADRLPALAELAAAAAAAMDARWPGLTLPPYPALG